MTQFDWGVEAGIAFYGFVRVLAWPFIRMTLPKVVVLVAGWLGQDLLRHYVDHHFVGRHDEH